MANASPQYKLTQAAENDFALILRKSWEDFGEDAVRRYTRLVSLVFQEIANRPELEGSHEFENAIRLYHLRHSKTRAAVDGITVGRPRHFVVYRNTEEGNIEIIRILHDAMDITAHLP